MMRTYGEIDGVSFKRDGYDIYNLANKYKLWAYGRNKVVYVNTMLELKSAITDFIQSEECRQGSNQLKEPFDGEVKN